jgi:hypothetical protein
MPEEERIEKGDMVRVLSKAGKLVWRKAKDGPGGAVGDLIIWWGKKNVRRKHA